LSGPSLLRLRRFGNAAARDAAYAADPALVDADVAAQQAALDGSLGPFSAPLAAELRALGWDASDLILGVPAIRDAWVRAHGPLPEVPGVTDPDALLAIGEIRRVDPDVVLEGNLNVLDRTVVAALRGSARPPRLLVGQLGTAKRFHRALDLDVVLVPCERIARTIRPVMRGTVQVLPHSFDPGVLDGLPERNVEHAITFAGALGPRYVLRHAVLMALLEATPLEAWFGVRKGVVRKDGRLVTPSEATASSFASRLRARLVAALPTSALVALAQRSERFAVALNVRLATRAGGRFLAGGDLEDPAARFAQRCHPSVGGRDYFALLRRSGIVVHREGDEMDGCGAALRVFEATGLGAVLLVDRSPMLEQLFTDDEVVMFDSPEDCVAKARWLLDHPAERERIAAAGQARTLRDHTTAARAATLSTILTEALARTA
jgi:hypothetical protein